MTTTDASDRVALVTGAGSGLGRAFTRALAAAGFRVAALGRDPASLEETISGLDSRRAVAVVADVVELEQVERAFDSVRERWGRLDVLVNNAGVFGPRGELDEVGMEEVRRTLDTNVIGAVNCSRAAWRIMREQRPGGGRIINNGSVSAQVPRPLSSAYTISKHAITGLTRALALDGRKHGIACGQIDIGNAGTPMTGALVEGALQADGSHAAEPVFDAAEAARAVVYMAGLPADANVLAMTVIATGMPFVGRG